MSRELEQARELVRMMEEKEKAAKVELSMLKPGQEFLIGNDEFIVLDQCVDGNDVTIVISKWFLAGYVRFGDTPDYKTSNLRKVIENDILPKIEAEIGADNILNNEVDLTTVDMQKDYGSLVCKARPYTFDEARKYNDLIVNKELNDWTWTCTPWSTSERGFEYSVAFMGRRGVPDNNGCGYEGGVRPILYLKSSIFVSLK